MTKELRAYLDGVRVGTFHQTAGGALGFVYAAGYLSRRGATPISRSMPLSAAQHSNRVVSAFLEGILPDNEQTRQHWAAQFGVSPRSAFALLGHVGRDAPGALQLLPPGMEADDAATQQGDVDWLSEVQFADLLRDLDRHSGTWGGDRLVGRWSLPGAMAKVALARDAESGRFGIPRDATPTTHIIKPAPSWLNDHHINEALCQATARELGLATAVAELIESDGVRAVVSQRYDRIQEPTGHWRRVHQEDLCQALGVSPAKKYQDDGGPGVGDIADLFATVEEEDRRSCSSQFFDALAFQRTHCWHRCPCQELLVAVER